MYPKTWTEIKPTSMFIQPELPPVKIAASEVIKDGGVGPMGVSAMNYLISRITGRTVRATNLREASTPRTFSSLAMGEKISFRVSTT